MNSQSNSAERVGFMLSEPDPAGPGRDQDPPGAPPGSGAPAEPVPAPDWMTEAEWLALCDATADASGLPDPAEEEGYRDPQDPALPGSEQGLAEIIAGSGRAAADAAAAAARIAAAGQTAAMAAV